MKTQRSIPGALALIILLVLASCQSGEEKAPVTDETATVDSAEVQYTPVQPEDGDRVDIARWYDMTYAEFDNLYADFILSDPPIVRDYGICDSVEVFFPVTEENALPEILICNLNGVYLVDDAFAMLGIDAGELTNTEGQWITVASLDDRFAGLKYLSAGTHVDRTTQLLLQFKR